MDKKSEYRSFDRDKQRTRALAIRTICLVNLKMFDLAVDNFEELRSDGKGRLEAWDRLDAECCTRLGRHERAVECAESLLRNKNITLNELEFALEIFISGNSYSNAKLCHELIARREKHPSRERLLSRFMVCRLLGEKANALSYLRRYMETGPMMGELSDDDSGLVLMGLDLSLEFGNKQAIIQMIGIYLSEGANPEKACVVLRRLYKAKEWNLFLDLFKRLNNEEINDEMWSMAKKAGWTEEPLTVSEEQMPITITCHEQPDEIIEEKNSIWGKMMQWVRRIMN